MRKKSRIFFLGNIAQPRDMEIFIYSSAFSLWYVFVTLLDYDKSGMCMFVYKSAYLYVLLLLGKQVCWIIQ